MQGEPDLASSSLWDIFFQPLNFYFVTLSPISQSIKVS